MVTMPPDMCNVREARVLPPVVSGAKAASSYPESLLTRRAGCPARSTKCNYLCAYVSGLPRLDLTAHAELAT